MIYVAPDASFEAVAQFETGLTGTLGVRILDNAGATTSARTTAGISEYPAGSGIYTKTFTAAPSTAGQYSLAWDDGSGNFAVDDLVVSYSRPAAASAAAGDLCDLDRVLGYLPGYSGGNTTIDGKLAQLITGQSVEIVGLTGGKEFVAITPTLNPRSFDISCANITTGKLRIGAATAISTVTQKRQGDTVRTIAAAEYVAEPRVRYPWQPITRLRFHRLSPSPVLLQEEDVIEIDATWGYPQVPADIAEACAKLVIVRYVNDIAKEGTEFADAVTADINIGALFVSAREAIDRYRVP